jgi:hypothetical protein
MAAISTATIIKAASTLVPLALKEWFARRAAEKAAKKAKALREQLERESLGVEVCNATVWKWALKRRSRKGE